MTPVLLVLCLQLPPEGSVAEQPFAQPLPPGAPVTTESSEIEHRRVRTNGITLHVAMAGPERGPLVVLLHGFPDDWRGWHGQIPVLAAQGYRVWAPDQRGYNDSDRPDGVAAYSLDLLVGDVLGLIEAAGREKAFLVGHDWGAAVAWQVARKAPEKLLGLVIMNVPHPVVMQHTITHNPRQALRSWYIGAFQVPFVADLLLGARDASLMATLLRNSGKEGTFSDDDIAHYRTAWTKPGAITAMIHWYRAGLRHPPSDAPERITVPTLLLWGEDDVALIEDMAHDSITLCERGRLVVIPGASHWVQDDARERVNAEMLAFFATGR